MIKRIGLVIIFVICFITMYPLIFMLISSIMGTAEINSYLAPIFEKRSGYILWGIIPSYPTLKSYVELFIDTPEFFVMFWNTIKVTIIILIGQLMVATPAAWGMIRVKSRIGSYMYLMYIVLMSMPFIVTMLPQYLVLDQLKLLDTDWALILPNIFSTFPVFIMASFFKGIPNVLIEHAKIDGASELQIFVKIVLPLGKPGIISAMFLSFIECWNMVEQPLTFIKSNQLWPVTLFLSNIKPENIKIALVASVITLIPAVLVFLLANTYLEQGFSQMVCKE